ncbi:hypothetical protein [Cerasicoccus arenae]|uniref:Uncharacterized protein n=1 Tax=Cerasicoccus arenae TaxID=424488 RepID=A0A8J3GDJ2_9BACT|nr:hypothetical protein [Cerasicoccus arenae]MBK1858221.1 hypothetical protein [Cerasicoccus arenae]GHC01986.1 hypothetical protein GCM10007047_18080 [Cerasicoccus arenae]
MKRQKVIRISSLLDSPEDQEQLEFLLDGFGPEIAKQLKQIAEDNGISTDDVYIDPCEAEEVEYSEETESDPDLRILASESIAKDNAKPPPPVPYDPKAPVTQPESPEIVDDDERQEWASVREYLRYSSAFHIHSFLEKFCPNAGESFGKNSGKIALAIIGGGTTITVTFLKVFS